MNTAAPAAPTDAVRLRPAAGSRLPLPHFAVSLRWIFAFLHLFALGIGLGAVWARGRALRGPLDVLDLRRAFYADAWWGVAAILWIGTGVYRLTAGLEKDPAYYLHNHLFWAKMGLFAVILILELGPMTSLMRWRSQIRHGQSPDTRRAGAFAAISFIQAVLLLLMVVAATGMARGY